MKPIRFLLPVWLLVSLTMGLARAETPSDIPNPLRTNRSWVADEAQVLSPSEEGAINNLLSPLERKNGTEVAVVTVHNLGGSTVEEFANDLFRLWKVGKQNKDNGVLILAAIDDRKIRIEVGYGLEGELTDGKAANIIRTAIVPNFREKNYGTGLLAASRAVAALAGGGEFQPPPAVSGRVNPGLQPTMPSQNVPTQNVPVQNAPSFNPPSQSSSPSRSGGSGGSGFLIFLAVLAGGGFIAWIIWQTSRPPKCPRCSTEMEQIPEAAEGQYLQPVQMLEQRLGSKDYKIWRCPKCSEQSVTEHNAMFSGYEDCPACRNRTLRVMTQTLDRPTEWSEGTESITKHCDWNECNYHSEQTRTLPRLPRNDSVATGAVIGGILGSSSSSSGSSSNDSWSSNDSSSSSSFDSGPSDFGGGDSGGGGASSDW